MRHTIGILFFTLFSLSSSFTHAQDLYDYTGSLIAKVSPISLNDADIGAGAALEYRFSKVASTQLAVDYIYGGTEPDMVRCSGIKFRPELRVYLPNRRIRGGAKSHVDAYFGLEIALKYVKTNFEEWLNSSNNYSSYKQFAAYETKNFAAGAVLKFGIQGYITSARNIVFDFSVGAGPVHNNVKGMEDLKKSNPNYNEDNYMSLPFSENKRQGLYAQLCLDLKLGFRF